MKRLVRGRSSAAMLIASMLAAVALVPACADEEILLATLPPDAPGGAPLDERRCVETTECPTRSFCARSKCGDVAGACAARPVVCEEAAAPVCGCNGITYWNDCLRRAAGVTAMMPGECTRSAVTCGGPGVPGPGGPPPAPTGGCPADTVCARLLPPPPLSPPPPDACPPDAPGTCWALPAVCPPSAGPDRWVACGPPGANPCKTTCNAIRTGEPHRRAIACP